MRTLIIWTYLKQVKFVESTVKTCKSVTWSPMTIIMSALLPALPMESHQQPKVTWTTSSYQDRKIQITQSKRAAWNIIQLPEVSCWTNLMAPLSLRDPKPLPTKSNLWSRLWELWTGWSQRLQTLRMTRSWGTLLSSSVTLMRVIRSQCAKITRAKPVTLLSNLIVAAMQTCTSVQLVEGQCKIPKPGLKPLHNKAMRSSIPTGQLRKARSHHQEGGPLAISFQTTKWEYPRSHPSCRRANKLGKEGQQWALKSTLTCWMRVWCII